MDTKNKHSGHRKRMRELIDNVGLKSLSDVQIVEQILNMTNKRKDTNPIAHNLLNKFGSIKNILEANYEELTSVEGVGPATAKMITYLMQIFEIYLDERLNTNFTCTTFGDIYNYFYPRFANELNECVYVGYIHNKKYFLCCEKICDGEINFVEFDKSKLAKKLTNGKSNQIIIAHNHPFGSTDPSDADYDTHKELVNLTSSIGVEIIDNIIIEKGGYFSIKNNTYIKIL